MRPYRAACRRIRGRSEEHTSELQSPDNISYADDVANAMARRGYDGTLRDTGARPLRIGGWLTLAAGLAAAIVAVII